MHLDQLATNAARSVIVPLDDVAEQIDLAESDFTPAVWGPGIYNGSRYGIPLDVHSLAMYWNKDHFEKAGIGEAPTDAATLDEACRKLKSAGFQPFWMPNQWPAHLMFFSLLWQFGGEPYAEDGSEATFGPRRASRRCPGWWSRSTRATARRTSTSTRSTAFKNGQNSITWDGSGRSTTARPPASDSASRPSARSRRPRTPPLLHDEAGRRGRQPRQRVEAVHRSPSQESGRRGR
jgi:multiple sugar transport system substrate-binding protein